jgi:hypothetical protein
VFAKALRDYGAIVVDTGGVSNIQVAGAHNPKAKEIWSSLGIKAEGDSSLLDGLMTATNMYVVAPPMNNCIDGTRSTYFCRYLTSQYKNSAGQIIDPPSTANSTNSQTTTPANPPSPTPALSPSEVLTNIIPSTPGAPIVSLDLSLPERRYNLSIKWGASLVKGGVKEYIIARNGVEVARTTKLSYTDKTVEASKPYIYSVQAIGINGNRSLPAVYSIQIKCAWVFCSI